MSINISFLKQSRKSYSKKERIVVFEESTGIRTSSIQNSIFTTGYDKLVNINAISSKINFGSWDYNHSEIINTSPVYVEKEDGKDVLRYNPKRMLPEKLYEVIWNDTRIGLLKTKKQKIIMFEKVK